MTSGRDGEVLERLAHRERESPITIVGSTYCLVGLSGRTSDLKIKVVPSVVRLVVVFETNVVIITVRY